MPRRRPHSIPAAAMLAALSWSLCASIASAQGQSAGARVPAKPGSFSLKIDTGVSWPLARPQSRRFEMGGSETVKALWSVKPYLDLGPSATFVALPAEDAAQKGGTAWAFGGGAQLKRPHHRDGRLLAVSPWLDGDLLYVRTEPLNRLGFSIGAGVALPLGNARIFWLGPLVRYTQIVSGPRAGFDDRDAKILSLGLSLTVGSGAARKPVEAAQATPSAPPREECPDRDGDGLPDRIDRCPEVGGTMEHGGCPQYEKIVVKPDKLELREKLYFAWDQAILHPVSYPVLDEVVQALTENSLFQVQIEGHTSSDGSDAHNQELSEQRASAVLDYLVAHGIASERLTFKGLSSTVPLDTNRTAAGRERNRRVEFVVQLKLVEDANAP